MALFVNRSSDSASSDSDIVQPKRRKVLKLSSESSSNSDSDKSCGTGFSEIEEDNNDNSPSPFQFGELSGPKHCPPKTSAPIAYFNLFFNSYLLNLISTETNRYFNQVKGND